MSQGSSPILNPVVYLNYLNHTVAHDYELTRDVSLATLGALAWDILSSIPEDCRLIQTGKISAVLSAYFLARPSALAMVVLDVMLKTGPINNCTVVATVLMALQAVSTAASSYLFLKRVHAVYYGNNIVKYFFSFLWLAGVGTSCAIFPGNLHDYSEIADTKHCLRYQNQAQLFITYAMPVVFDFLVYSAISHKIHKINTTHGSPKKWCWRDIWRGKAFPHFSQAILSGGQQYYLITNWIIIIRLSFGQQSPTLRLLFSSPAVALTGVMACRVYRNLIIESLLDLEWTNRKPPTAPKSTDRRAVRQTLPTSTVSVSPYSESDVERGCSVPKGEV